MKKTIAMTAAFLLSAGLFTACGKGNATSMPGANDGTIRIVTTIFPEYDWIQNILGDDPAGAEVTMLLDSGVDLHSYQPTADDMLKISTCDLFVYVGGESDDWVDDALQEATNPDMIVINLLDVLGEAAKEEEVVEGMQEEAHDHGEEAHAGEEHEGHEEHEEHEEHEDHEEHGEDADEEHAGDHGHEETEYDEHVWLSLQNAELFCLKIKEAIAKIDPEHAATYESNAKDYIGELQAMDARYREAVDQASLRTLLFGDRFPFRYLTDDYGLDYYAAFAGCSAETEASFETVTFLAQKADELGLHTVLSIEGTEHRVAETIVQNTQAKNQQILVMDSMQATTGKDVEGGATYLSVMDKNLEVLIQALQ